MRRTLPLESAAVQAHSDRGLLATISALALGAVVLFLGICAAFAA